MKLVSLSVEVKNHIEQAAMVNLLHGVFQGWHPSRYLNLSVIHHDDTVEEPEKSEEFHDEETLFKVRAALVRIGLGSLWVNAAITEMQNAGILFRERK